MEDKMKAGKIIVVFLIILIVIGIVVGIYFYGKSKSSQTTNIIEKTIYVKALDAKTQEQVKTNFIIVQNGSIIYQGETQTDGAEEIKVNLNTNLSAPYFLNYGNGYYGNAAYYIQGDNFEMNLYKIGVINISLDGKTLSEYIINFTALNGQWRQYGFCVKWSYNYLDVFSEIYKQINSPLRFESYDKCFLTEDTLDYNVTESLTLNYRVMDNLTTNDYIQLVLFDSDRSWKNEYIIETETGENNGGEDIVFEIKGN